MIATIENQVIALSGIFQAVNTVKQLAYKGSCEQGPFDASIHSVLSMNTDSVAQIFDNNRGVRTGLEVLREQLLSDTGNRDPELSRYAITIIHLEARLRSNTGILERLRQGIIQLESQVNLSGMSDAIIGNMAELYRDTISQLTPRIMVNGESHHLSDELTASKIRATLLAAVRSAVLWRQCGGTRLKLLFKRNSYLEQADRLIRTLPPESGQGSLP